MVIGLILNPFTKTFDFVNNVNVIDEDCIVFRKQMSLVGDSCFQLATEECLYIAEKSAGNVKINNIVDIEGNGTLRISDNSQVEVLNV